MEEILNSISAYIAVIGPSITAILATVAAAIINIKRVNKSAGEAVSHARQTSSKIKTVESANIKLEKTVEELKTKVDTLETTNSEIVKQNTELNIALTEANSNYNKANKELCTIKNQLTKLLKDKGE